MLATNKQINYLCKLAKKVEDIKVSFPELRINTKYINWQTERHYGVTINDASARISAYRTIIGAANMQIKMLGLK